MALFICAKYTRPIEYSAMIYATNKKTRSVSGFSYTNSKYELRSYLESRWRRQSRLAPCETFGFERLLAHPPHSNSSIFNLEFE